MFKIVKVSPKHHEKLKQYAKQKDKTMKRILEDAIDKLNIEKTYGIRLKIDGSKKHV